MEQNRDSKNVFIYMWELNDKAIRCCSRQYFLSDRVCVYVCVRAHVHGHMCLLGKMEMQRGFWNHLVFFPLVILDSIIFHRFSQLCSLAEARLWH